MFVLTEPVAFVLIEVVGSQLGYPDDAVADDGEDGDQMDPITTILAALAAAGGHVVGQALTDGYAGLKSLIVRRFGEHRPGLGSEIDGYVADPDGRAEQAATELHRAGVDADEEVLARSRELLKRAHKVDPSAIGALVHRIEAKNVAVIWENNGPITFS